MPPFSVVLYSTYIYNATLPEKRTEEKVNTTSPAATQSVVWPFTLCFFLFVCLFVFCFASKIKNLPSQKKLGHLTNVYKYLLVHVPRVKVFFTTKPALILLLACNHVCFLCLLFTLGILNGKLLSLHG